MIIYVTSILIVNYEGSIDIFNNFYRLNFVFESLDLLLNEVSGDLVILEICFDLNRESTLLS